MKGNKIETNLGFTNNPVPVGTHICLVFSTDEERTDALLKYLLYAIKEEEKAACFSDRITEEEIRYFFKENHLSYDESVEKGQLSLSGTGEVYFKNDEFVPERMLENLKDFYNIAKKEDYCACRVIGEMEPEVVQLSGGDRLMEYESRVSLLVRDYPITTLCQYDARKFDGATILDIMKVHPRMYVNGEIIENPFFITPDVFLKDHCCHDA